MTGGEKYYQEAAAHSLDKLREEIGQEDFAWSTTSFPQFEPGDLIKSFAVETATPIPISKKVFTRSSSKSYFFATTQYCLSQQNLKLIKEHSSTSIIQKLADDSFKYELQAPVTSEISAEVLTALTTMALEHFPGYAQDNVEMKLHHLALNPTDQEIHSLEDCDCGNCRRHELKYFKKYRDKLKGNFENLTAALNFTVS